MKAILLTIALLLPTAALAQEGKNVCARLTRAQEALVAEAMAAGGVEGKPADWLGGLFDRAVADIVKQAVMAKHKAKADAELEGLMATPEGQ
jgi:hypothetical protein